MRRARPVGFGAFVTAFLTIVVLAGCSGDDEAQGDAGSSTTVTEATIPTTNAFAQRLCAAGDPQRVGEVSEAALVETSGIILSRTHPGVIWAHNDSGDTARVFALDSSGEALGQSAIGGAQAFDWEDIAIGPAGEDDDFLYLGDIGDNLAVREDVTVYRVDEPSPSDSTGMLLADRIDLTYPDGPHDAEALLVDPRDGDLFVVTKSGDGASGVYRLADELLPAAGEKETTSGELELVATLALGGGELVTAGDIAADGSAIVLRTYRKVWVWERRDGEAIAEAFGRAPCEAPAPAEFQGEAIALEPDASGYVTIAEGARPSVWHVP